MLWLDRLPWSVITLACLNLGLAPFATPLALAARQVADEPTEQRTEGEQQSETRRPGRGWILFPVDDPYRESLAGPHRRGFGVTQVDLAATDIPDTGDRLFGLLVGGRFGLARVHFHGRPDRGWQLGIEAGFYGQFDIDRSYDGIGWDGFYGLALTGSLADRWAVKLGVLHTSSHVGDEYAERTGRLRIGYTREELVVGVSRSLGERWRILVEGGWGYDLRNEALQEAERLRMSVEHLAGETLWRGRLGWYAAVDCSTLAERDWQLDWAVDVGLLLSQWPRRWRLGLEYYDGRTPLGEFFQSDQRSLTLGLWLDL
jgi:hypothetical protein